MMLEEHSVPSVMTTDVELLGDNFPIDDVYTALQLLEELVPSGFCDRTALCLLLEGIKRQVNDISCITVREETYHRHADLDATPFVIGMLTVLVAKDQDVTV